MNVVEIFQSIDGEGKLTGIPATFIRLAGCNLRCSYCDTSYAQMADQGTSMSIEQILSSVHSAGLKHITLTGGEPLIHSDVSELIQSLVGANYMVNVETNGTVDIAPYRDSIITRSPHMKLFFTVDFKLPSSGHHTDMRVDYSALTVDDVIKFVAGTEEDLIAVDEFLLDRRVGLVQKFISPVYNQMNPQRLVEWVLAEPHRHNVRVQVQLHKVIWSPEMRGV